MPKIDPDKARKMVADGATASAIAKEFACSASAVSQFLSRYKLTLHGRRGNKRKQDRAILPGNSDARIVPHIPGYSVTADGRVWSELSDPPYEIAARLKHGRPEELMPRVQLGVNGKRVSVYVATLVIEAFHGARPDGHVIGYRDGDTTNCTSENLYWREANRSVKPEEFIRVWQSSSSAMEVVERLGITAGYAYSRAKQIREHGVPLKTFMREKVTDWESLAALAKSLAD